MFCSTTLKQFPVGCKGKRTSWRTIQTLQYLITLIQQPLYLLATTPGTDRSTLWQTLASSVRCFAIMFMHTPTHVYVYTYTCLNIHLKVLCTYLYIHLFIVKSYNEIEDAVHRICLLVPQDINSVQKSLFAVYCYNGVTLN